MLFPPHRRQCRGRPPGRPLPTTGIQGLMWKTYYQANGRREQRRCQKLEGRQKTTYVILSDPSIKQIYSRSRTSSVRPPPVPRVALCKIRTVMQERMGENPRSYRSRAPLCGSCPLCGFRTCGGDSPHPPSKAYRSIFSYRVRRPIPKICAALDLLPPIAFNTLRIWVASTSAIVRRSPPR